MLRADSEISPQLPVAGYVRVPPELIIASGVGHEVTNWHLDQTPADSDPDEGSDVPGVDR